MALWLIPLMLIGGAAVVTPQRRRKASKKRPSPRKPSRKRPPHTRPHYGPITIFHFGLLDHNGETVDNAEVELVYHRDGQSYLIGSAISDALGEVKIEVDGSFISTDTLFHRYVSDAITFEQARHFPVAYEQCQADGRRDVIDPATVNLATTTYPWIEARIRKGKFSWSTGDTGYVVGSCLNWSQLTKLDQSRYWVEGSPGPVVNGSSLRLLLEWDPRGSGWNQRAHQWDTWETPIFLFDGEDIVYSNKYLIVGDYKGASDRTLSFIGKDYFLPAFESPELRELAHTRRLGGGLGFEGSGWDLSDLPEPIDVILWVLAQAEASANNVAMFDTLPYGMIGLEGDDPRWGQFYAERPGMHDVIRRIHPQVLRQFYGGPENWGAEHEPESW